MKKTESGVPGSATSKGLGLRSSSLSNSQAKGYMVNDTEVARALQMQRPMTAMEDSDLAGEKRDFNSVPQLRDEQD